MATIICAHAGWCSNHGMLSGLHPDEDPTAAKQRRPLVSITAVWLQRQSRKACGTWMSPSGGPAVAKKMCSLMFKHRIAIVSFSRTELCRNIASCCREAHSDEELWACSRLRAQCFYAYPPDREFAGKVSCYLRQGPCCVLLCLLRLSIEGVC
jgi:hypothetical protein